jgi:hypothetical protein
MGADRELLELAAKAAGMKPRDEWAYDEEWGIKVSAGTPPYEWWNPLTDDGDALRLAVKLGHRIDTPKYKDFGSSCNNVTVFCDGCPYAQTRRAIVMAAAEIGKATP